MIVTLIMTMIMAVIVTILMMSMDLVKYFERTFYQVRLCGGGPMSTGTTSDELDFAAPFGPTATPVRGRKWVIANTICNSQLCLIEESDHCCHSSIITTITFQKFLVGPLFVNNSREVSNEASVKAGTSSQVKTRIKVKAEIVRIGNSSPARTRILAFQTRTRTGRFSPARTKAENKGYFLNRAQVPTKSPALTSRSPTSAPALKLSKTLALAPDNTNSPLVNLQPARATRLWKQLRMLRPCLVLNPSSLWAQSKGRVWKRRATTLQNFLSQSLNSAQPTKRAP